jgi:hypothetical protein
VGIPDGNEEKEAEREADRELLEELRESARQNGGRYPEENVISFLRQQLKSSPCRNQGYVLDGYPKRAEEASPLFKCGWHFFNFFFWILGFVQILTIESQPYPCLS